MSGALPTKFSHITDDYNKFKGKFTLVDKPYNHCVCIHFHKKAAVHIGVFYNGFVYHVSSKSASRIKDTRNKFEAKAKRTEYWSYDNN